MVERPRCELNPPGLLAGHIPEKIERLLKPIGNIPPPEYEKQYYERSEESAMVE